MAIRFEPPTETAPEPARRRGSIRGWVRELIAPEPADVRRQRLEAEAAAEWRFAADHEPEQRAS